MRDIRSRSEKKAKSKFMKNSVDGLCQGEIVSGAKKMLDNKEGKVKVEEKETRKFRSRARINGSMVNEGKIGPWKYQE